MSIRGFDDESVGRRAHMHYVLGTPYGNALMNLLEADVYSITVTHQADRLEEPVGRGDPIEVLTHAEMLQRSFNWGPRDGLRRRRSNETRDLGAEVVADA